MSEAFKWLVFDPDNGVVGLVEGPRAKADALLVARKRYGPRLVERVQSLTDAEIAALERDAIRKRRLPV